MSPNVAASVHQRLLDLAHTEGHSFSALLQHYALERFLYRLGLSPYVDRFVLKGALMFKVWQGYGLSWFRSWRHSPVGSCLINIGPPEDPGRAHRSSLKRITTILGDTAHS